MATVVVPIDVMSGRLRTTAFPSRFFANGSAYPVMGYAFDAATEEAVFYTFKAKSYGSGNLTLEVEWYADTASSGNVVWGAAIAAITPNTDTQDIETDALATANTVIDAHLGTTGQRLHTTSITISNLDSLAADDYVTIRVYRDADDGTNDTMTGDAILVGLTITYSDT